MSSPTSRRSTRSSANNTPNGRNQRNSASQRAPPSSDPAEADDANSQLLSEANASANGTPRGSQRSQRASVRGTPRASQQTDSQSQQPPASSPLFFQSSPAGSQSQSQSQNLGVPANGSVHGSSPLRQRNDVQMGSSEGGRTPRAAPGVGGEPQRSGGDNSATLLRSLSRLLPDPLRLELRCCRSRRQPRTP